MKEFLRKNYRFTLLVVAFVIVSVSGFSYAYAVNENTIYTRDELSELVNEINTKQVELSDIGATATLYSEDNIVNYPGNTNFKIFEFTSSEFFTAKPNIYEYSNYGIKVKKSGYYILNAQVYNKMTTDSLWVSFSIYTNDKIRATDGEFINGGNGYSLHLTTGGTFYLYENDIITLRIYNEAALNVKVTYLTATYLGY